MDTQCLAWVILRLCVAWIFMYPLKDLLRDWPGTVSLAGLLFPKLAKCAAVAMVLVMFFGALSILLGVYAQLFAILLCMYSLMGVVVHMRLAGMVKQAAASLDQENDAVTGMVTLGVVGHTTSAWKNIPLAAICFYLAVFGVGPMTVTANLW